MIRTIAAAAIIGAGVSFLAGCAVPQQSSMYSPYYQPGGDQDEMGQGQFCGALGSCTPANDAPYAMHGNVD